VSRPSPAPRVLAISPPRPGAWVDQLDALANAGVDGLVLRLVGAPDRLADVLARVDGTRLPLWVRPVRAADVALALAADLPLHLPATVPVPPGATTWGRSCHGAAALADAAAEGSRYALLSPVFSPGSKPGDTRPTLGVDGLAAMQPAGLPVLALGGIDPARAAACVRAGAHGVAGIGAFFADAHVRRNAARALVDAVRGALARPRSG